MRGLLNEGRSGCLNFKQCTLGHGPEHWGFRAALQALLAILSNHFHFQEYGTKALDWIIKTKLKTRSDLKLKALVLNLREIANMAERAIQEGAETNEPRDARLNFMDSSTEQDTTYQLPFEPTDALCYSGGAQDMHDLDDGDDSIFA
ncbi:hypothetical protein EBZ37_14320 [bacterium]|nr:hypothetical protein [bacterium]